VVLAAIIVTVRCCSDVVRLNESGRLTGRLALLIKTGKLEKRNRKLPKDRKEEEAELGTMEAQTPS
jgi:hypothetical protein